MTNLKEITAMEPVEVMIPQGTEAWLDYRQNGRDGKPFITGTGMPAIVPHPDIEGKYCQTLFETNCPQALADLLNGKTKIRRNLQIPNLIESPRRLYLLQYV